MAELLNNSDFQEFTLEQLKTSEGIVRLNAILKQLSQNIPNTDTIKVFVGNGTPEASITAGIGSVYLRADGAATTAVYFKTSGTGNTGWSSVASPGTGDVVGPSSATDGDVVIFDGTTGKLVKDSGTLLSSLGNVTAAANMADNYIIRGDGGAKGVQDSLVVIDDSGNVRTASGLGFYISPNSNPMTGGGVFYGLSTSEVGLIAAEQLYLTGNTGTTILFLGSSSNPSVTASIQFNSSGGNGNILTASKSKVTLNSAETDVSGVMLFPDAGSGLSVPTSQLHLHRQTTSASTAPIKFSIDVGSPDSLMTTPEAGAVEYGANLYFTNYKAIRFSVGGTIFNHYTDSGNSTTTETDLYTDTLLGNTFYANGDKVISQYGGTYTGAAASTQRLRTYLGGTLIFDSGALSIGVATNSWNLSVTCVRESSSNVRCLVVYNSDFAAFNSSATYTKVTGLTLTSTQILKITGQAAGAGALSNQIVASEGYIEFKPAV